MMNTYSPDLLVIDVFTETPVDDLYDMDRESDTDMEKYDERLGDVCERLSDYVTRADLSGEFDDVEDSDELVDMLLEGLPVYEEFHNTAFRKLVTEWLQHKLHAEPKEIVRGYAEINHGFAMVHGIGYDWLDADVLGGNGDGNMRAEFNEWCVEEFGVSVNLV